MAVRRVPGTFSIRSLLCAMNYCVVKMSAGWCRALAIGSGQVVGGDAGLPRAVESFVWGPADKGISRILLGRHPIQGRGERSLLLRSPCTRNDEHGGRQGNRARKLFGGLAESPPTRCQPVAHGSKDLYGKIRNARLAGRARVRGGVIGKPPAAHGSKDLYGMV